MIRVLAPAKVNLTLRILGRRPDGYHDIESLVQKISLYDRITLDVRDKPGILMTCTDPTLPCGPDNLAYRAARLILGRAGTAKKGLSIHLDKHIPHGSGLGGGSSDAASVLMALNSLLELSLALDELKELALQIGSDVPLFLYPSPAVISGRGEKVEPCALLVNTAMLVVIPGFRVSAKWAYSNFRLTKEPDNYTISALYRTPGGVLPPEQWQDLFVNDLEETVTIRHPEIGRCREDLLRAGADAALMSGSGSAVFGLFRDKRSAEKAAAVLMEDGTKTTRVALPIFS